MSQYITEGDKFARLPKWAQEQVKYMQRDIDSLEEGIASLRNPDPTPTRTLHDPYGETARRSGRGKQFLNPQIQTRFVLGDVTDSDHNYIDCRVRQEYTGAKPELYLMGSEGIELAPHSSNTMSVWVQR